MDPEPLLAASLAIRIHTAAAVFAAAFALFVLACEKGTGYHVVAGYGFAASMIIAAASSFAITEVFPGRFSPIHFLSVVRLASIPLAIYFRRLGKLRAHAIAMIGPLIGLFLAGAATLLPGRVLHAVVFG